MDIPSFNPGDDTYQYLLKVREYYGKVNGRGYALIFKFVKAWMRDVKLNILGLEDIKNISQFAFPTEEKSKYVLREHVKGIVKEVRVKYKFKPKEVKERYGKMLEEQKRKKKKERESQKNGKKSAVDMDDMMNVSRVRRSKYTNAANDYRYPYRVEVIRFLRLVLPKIGYNFNSRSSGDNILWSIKRNRRSDVMDRYKELKRSWAIGDDEEDDEDDYVSEYESSEEEVEEIPVKKKTIKKKKKKQKSKKIKKIKKKKIKKRKDTSSESESDAENKPDASEEIDEYNDFNIFDAEDVDETVKTDKRSVTVSDHTDESESEEDDPDLMIQICG